MTRNRIVSEKFVNQTSGSVVVDIPPSCPYLIMDVYANGAGVSPLDLAFNVDAETEALLGGLNQNGTTVSSYYVIPAIKGTRTLTVTFAAAQTFFISVSVIAFDWNIIRKLVGNSSYE